MKKIYLMLTSLDSIDDNNEEKKLIIVHKNINSEEKENLQKDKEEYQNLDEQNNTEKANLLVQEIMKKDLDINKFQYKRSLPFILGKKQKFVI